jgi:hypothetical protein
MLVDNTSPIYDNVLWTDNAKIMARAEMVVFI